MDQSLPKSRRQRVVNFGGNVFSRPHVVEVPRSEEEVLALLAAHRGKKIRVVGRLHSWSEAARADEVLVDLRHLRRVEVLHDADGPLAVVGAGCQIKRVLNELARHGLTMPTLGLISEQTIAGAAATGTHGSGRHSLSHYVCQVRLAHYDPGTGEPTIRVIDGGDELAAARCAVGCLGIILSVAFRPRPAYAIEEWLARHEDLDAVLAAEEETPLQQFYVIPWLWTYVGQHRRESRPPLRGVPDATRNNHGTRRSRGVFSGTRRSRGLLYRWYWFLALDIGLHAVLQFLVQVLRSDALVKAFYRHVALLTVIRNWHVVDDSAAMLIMEHELFRHIEIELFVKRSDLAAALTFLRQLLEHCGGDRQALSAEVRKRLEALGLGPELEALCGAYTHHYVICVRRVLPDETLISMTAGDDQPRYALSLISYARPHRRESFFRFAAVAARSMAALFDARPHWGKVLPLDAPTLASLYPGLARFREICRQLDPGGVFANEWAEETLLA